VDAPLPDFEKRDPKGLYRKARKETIKDFKGLSSPYEAPDNPEIHVTMATETIDDSLENIMSCITPALFIN
jgi:adenylylsulfate kinase-like enzyme